MNVFSDRIERRKIDAVKSGEIVVQYKIKVCKGIAYDWYGKNIYWTDEIAGTISLVSVKSVKDFSKRKTLIRDSMMRPRTIALSPATG